LGGDDWRAVFDGYREEAFRLETLPAYAVDGEEDEYAAFLATGELNLPAEDPWLVRVRGYRAGGRWIGRVHIVTQPLSDYLRYEFAAYRYNVQAGEDVRILDVTDRPNPLAGFGDFWLFDRTKVVAMHYRPDGTQSARELLDGAELDRYRQARDTALSLAVPFAEYDSN
jgi:hypothetical protein